MARDNHKFTIKSKFLTKSGKSYSVLALLTQGKMKNDRGKYAEIDVFLITNIEV